MPNKKDESFERVPFWRHVGRPHAEERVVELREDGEQVSPEKVRDVAIRRRRARSSHTRAGLGTRSPSRVRAIREVSENRPIYGF